MKLYTQNGFDILIADCHFLVLQALCTEAALNAIQRRYPQVYKSNDRLLLKPETIGVGLRDFMISIKSNFLYSWTEPISLTQLCHFCFH